MEDQSPQNTMNLDLNLGPVINPFQDDHPPPMNFEDWLLGSMREVVSNRLTSSQQLPPVLRQVPAPMEARNTGLGLTGGSASNKRPSETIKTNVVGDKNVDRSSFFDCNICLDLASEPVVTCCGHLFCWPCIYRWLFVHSDAKECPICKGEVTMKTITPIYSRGNRMCVTELTDANSSVKIPSRPEANRIESWRQSIQRNAVNMPVIEMIRRLDNRFDLTRDTVSNYPQEIPSALLLNRIFTSRGIRGGRDTVPAGSPDAAVDLPNRADAIPNLTSAESFVDSYFRDHPEERDSMSSVAAIIQSDSQTAETDSRVSVSTTSRRRCESSTSRVSDVNSGESRPRRRRLQ